MMGALRSTEPMTWRSPLVLLGVASLSAVLVAGPAAAQVQQFILGPGSSVGSETKVEPKNCVTDPKTGAITCDTQLVNPPGDTQAKPSYTPFGN
ncbi:MAG: hypothetical protein RLZZ336_1681 [Cyanobacteriota bacterium]